MRRLSRLSVWVLVFCIVVSMSPAHGAPFFYDDFSADTRNLAQTNLINWDVLQGNVDVVNAGEPNGCPATAPGKCVDLDGSFISTLAILQTKSQFSFLTGHEYELFVDNSRGERAGPKQS